MEVFCQMRNQDWLQHTGKPVMNISHWVDNKIVPGFDESKIVEVHQIFDQMKTLQQHASIETEN
jgi:hypothetical protein